MYTRMWHSHEEYVFPVNLKVFNRITYDGLYTVSSCKATDQNRRTGLLAFSSMFLYKLKPHYNASYGFVHTVTSAWRSVCSARAWKNVLASLCGMRRHACTQVQPEETSWSRLLCFKGEKARQQVGRTDGPWLFRCSLTDTLIGSVHHKVRWKLCTSHADVFSRYNMCRSGPRLYTYCILRPIPCAGRQMLVSQPPYQTAFDVRPKHSGYRTLAPERKCQPDDSTFRPNPEDM
jgi:hypothetical protein